jgi:hypothetical protein
MTPRSTHSTSTPALKKGQPSSPTLAANAHHLPLLSLWGMQFAAVAILGQFELPRVPAWTVPASFWLAFAATLLHVIYYSLVAKRQQFAIKSTIQRNAAAASTVTTAAATTKQQSKRKQPASQGMGDHTKKSSRATFESSPTFMSSRLALDFVAILGLLLLLPVVLLLVSPPGVVLYTELYRALVLAGCYLLLGRFLSRRFTALALWLVLLTVITAWAYFGFAPFALGLMSGLSLMACHLMLHRMKAQERPLPSLYRFKTPWSSRKK